MTLSLTNTSEYIGQRGDTHWWSWTAYIEGDSDELDDVAYVEYHLHPGFPNPIKRVKKRNGGFPLTAKGWGVFELKAKVVFREKGRLKTLKHMLEFEGAEIEE